jgi:hypothetical protein
MSQKSGLRSQRQVAIDKVVAKRMLREASSERDGLSDGEK